MKWKSVFFCLLITVLVLEDSKLNAQTSLPEPSLTAKNISTVSGNVLLDGTKLPDMAGFTIGGSPVNNSIVSLVSGQIKFSSVSGVSDQYIMTLTNATFPVFEPTGNFTVEFKGRIVTSSGRGLDMVIKDGKSTSRTIAFHKDKIFLNSYLNPMYTLDATQEHTYTIVVDKETAGASRYYFYVDGVYVWGDQTSSATSATNVFALTFGKANANQNLEAYISYLAIDQTGAFKPIPQTTPVNLINYTVHKEVNAIKLIWQTATETNNSHYEIERSTDGKIFDKLTTVKAAGAGLYSYSDSAPLNGLNYYRLVQYDLDGTRNELGVKVIDYQLTNIVSIYPNPIKPGQTLYINSKNKGATFRLTDITGKILFEGLSNVVSDNLLAIDLPGSLSKGLYFLNELNKGSVKSKVIIN